MEVKERCKYTCDLVRWSANDPIWKQWHLASWLKGRIVVHRKMSCPSSDMIIIVIQENSDKSYNPDTHFVLEVGFVAMEDNV